MNVPDRIKYFRNEKGYSVTKLAYIAGVSQSYLRDIELGNKNPTINTLTLICDALGITLKDFFDESTTDSIEQNPLIHRIFQLSKEQQNALLNFLDTIE